MIVYVYTRNSWFSWCLMFFFVFEKSNHCRWSFSVDGHCSQVAEEEAKEDPKEEAQSE